MVHTTLMVEEVEIAGADGRIRPWPVSWTAVWVGALGALAAAVVLGLIGVSLGAHQLEPRRITSWHEFRLATLVFSVAASFFAFVIGGWATARVAGFNQAETAMVHGAVVWTLAVPMLLGLIAVGGSAYLGQWYGGLSGIPIWAATVPPAPDQAAAVAARNGALGAVTALLLGLVGAVLGGWMGSGQPMTLRRRPLTH